MPDLHSINHVGMAVDELCHRVQHHVGTEIQGLLQVRTGEGVVHHQQGAVLVRKLSRRPDDTARLGWIAILVIQSLPYCAAVVCSLIKTRAESSRP